MMEVIPAHTTVVGMRFHPGAPPPFPTLLDDLVDERLDLAVLWGSAAERLGQAVADATGPEAALALIQAELLHTFRQARPVDLLVREAVRHLMPWRSVTVGALASHLAISPSQLRRRCLAAVGVAPKVLQRTLRFQGFLALAQTEVRRSGRRSADGVAGMALDLGYADHAHLGRECRRLTGLTPRELLGGDAERCRCGHDHSASYLPFLAARRVPWQQ
jgi:AraC-like DNA-binding protein